MSVLLSWHEKVRDLTSPIYPTILPRQLQRYVSVAKMINC